MSTYALNVRHELDDEWMDCLIEMAGYGMGYWAHRAEESDPDRYTVWWLDDDTEKRKTVRRGALARAVQKILTQPMVNEHYHRQMNAAVYDAGEIDSDLADIVVQVALFGEVVYG